MVPFKIVCNAGYNWENRDSGLKIFNVEEGVPFSDEQKGSVFIEINKLKQQLNEKNSLIDDLQEKLSSISLQNSNSSIETNQDRLE